MPSLKEIGILTVAAIRSHKGPKPTEYLFNQRERIFTLKQTVKSAEFSKRLKDAFRKKIPVKAFLDTGRGVIHSAQTPSQQELDAFQSGRVLFVKPDRVVPIDVSSIDPTTFNIVDRYLKWATFKLCKTIVPDYKTAKEIFDYCANQSCHLPGPYDITPCIPFQYVIDGCYARAHKMWRIITNEFSYCCDKVFSFANQNDDHLSVKADKWGGCCIGWWFHVAPLIRVKVGNIAVVALVIDPGMFDKPVLLSTWLSAQENTNCHPDAKVSMYSIQPGSAYLPDNDAGTAYTTDPADIHTNQTLIDYADGITCH
ncbi:hypothetical protein L0222_05920 [bacterium]|nr:hypothetical protein [bacterium]